MITILHLTGFNGALTDMAFQGKSAPILVICQQYHRSCQTREHREVCSGSVGGKKEAVGGEIGKGISPFSK
jgi:hypothetical protein